MTCLILALIIRLIFAQKITLSRGRNVDSRYTLAPSTLSPARATSTKEAVSSGDNLGMEFWTH